MDYKRLINQSHFELCQRLEAFTTLSAGINSMNIERANQMFIGNYGKFNDGGVTTETKPEETSVDRQKKFSEEIDRFRIKFSYDINALTEKLNKLSRTVGRLESKQKQSQIIKIQDSVHQISHQQQSKEQKTKITSQSKVGGQQIKNSSSQTKIPSPLKKPKTFYEWIDPTCNDYSKIKFTDNLIKGKSSIHLFGRYVIQSEYEFSVDVLSLERHLALGVISRSYKNKNHIAQETKYRIIYWSGGNYRVGDTEQKIGVLFGTKQTVRVKIDIDKGYISWTIGENQTISRSESILMQPGVQWVPYIRMVGDTTLKLSDIGQ